MEDTKDEYGEEESFMQHAIVRVFLKTLGEIVILY
jgi:hypothetical protein